MDTAVRTADDRGRVDRESVALGVVDVSLLTALVLFGRTSHGGSPIADPLASLETVAPFVLGWVVAALLAGVYARGVSTSVARAARTTTVAWIAAANIGLILRASPLFDGSATWPFPLVITGFGLVVLSAWRIGYAAFAGARA